MRRIRRTTAIIPVLLVGALALSGCSAIGGGGSSASGGASGSSGSTARDAAPQTAEGVAAGGAKTLSPTERDTVVTGSVGLTVDAPVSTAARVAALAVASGGRVDGRTEQAATRDTPASATLVIRVPSSKVDRIVAQLKELGRDAKVATHADDVTAVHQDTAARIDALETSIARLQEFVTTASATKDLIELESEISSRQAELESLQAQQRGLDDQISLATLTVSLDAPGTAVKPAPGDFGSGVVLGWAAFTSFVGWLAVVLGVALPWLVLAGLVLAAVFGIRALRRRTSMRRPDRSTHGADPA